MSADDSELFHLQAAIEALEAQRSRLGDAVVDAALAPLNRRLDSLRLQPAPGQRKLVSVLFTDLVGFTALAEKLDPEDVREIVGLCFERWSEVLRRHEGVVEKYAGDAVMAVFGLERARENDPHQAVLAGLELVAETRRLRQVMHVRFGVDLRLRVGIHTGPVVVTFGSRLPGQDFSVVGDTVNLASRLQALAPVNGVLISQETYRHLRGAFLVQAVEAVKVKGRSQPVKVYVAIAPRSRDDYEPTHGVEGISTPLVGRAVELEALTRLFLGMTELGNATAVLLAGEAGIGKSRLLTAFDAWLAQERVQRIKARSNQASRFFPFALLRDIFSRLSSIHDSDSPEQAASKLRAALAHAGVNQAVSGAADLAALLGYQPFPEEIPPGTDRFSQPATNEIARQTYERGVGLLYDYFAACLQRGPLVLLVEDLHWADASSISLLQRLFLAFADRPILLVCTTRPVLFERLPEWSTATGPAGISHFYRFVLEPLPLEASRALLEAILVHVADAPLALFERITNLAEGNPFYLEELVKVLLDDGVIVKGETYWAVHLERLAAMRLPATLTGVLQARLDSLDGEHRRALQSAAVIGRSFWDRAVAYLLAQGEEPRARTDLPAIDATLTYLAHTELLQSVEQTAFSDAQEYQFKHTLLRDVAYESLLRRQRALYHALAAHWLQDEVTRSRRDSEFTALIAWHFDQAGDYSNAAVWYLQAARQAAGKFANVESVRYASRALELVPPEDSQVAWELLRLRLNANDLLGERAAQLADVERLMALAERLERVELRFEALLLRADYHERITDFPEMMNYARYAHDLAEQAFRQDGIVRRQQAEALLRWGGAFWRQASYAEGIEKVQAASKIAQELGDEELEADCLRNLGAIAWQQSDYASAGVFQQQALVYYLRTGNKTILCQVYTGLGNIALHLRQLDAGRQAFSQAVELARQVGHPRREADALNGLGLIDESQGDFVASRQRFEQAASIYLRLQEMDGYSAALSNLGSASHSLGDFSAARRSYEIALEVQRRSHDREGALISTINLGLLYLQKGERGLAWNYCQEALDEARRQGSRWVEGYALIYVGHLHLEAAGFVYGQAAPLQHAGNEVKYDLLALQAAQDSYHQAAELRRQLSQPALLQDALAGLARAAWVRASLGERVLSEALALVEEILDYAARHGMDGVDEPALVYLTCYGVLYAAGDARAAQTLAAGRELLLRRAGKINAPDLRESYLTNLPAHAALMQLWNTQERTL